MSTTYELTGKVASINDVQTFASGFTKREFVIETQGEKYPQMIKLEAVKEGCIRLDAYRLGDDITVSFNIRGNEYNGKYYVSLQAWKFDRAAAQSTPISHQPVAQATRPEPDQDLADDDDIPF